MDKAALTSRIDRLESLLLAVTDTNTNITQFPHVLNNLDVNPQIQKRDDMELLRQEFGVLKVEPTQTVYHGGQHWVSTMFQVQEFRDYLEANSDDLGRIATEKKKDTENTVSLLRGENTPLSKEELLSSVPSQSVTDMLVTHFFEHISNNICMLLSILTEAMPSNSFT
jgi:hypothetical protein